MKRLIIDLMIIVVVVVSFFVTSILCEGAELIAPTTCKAGELAVVRCEESASWTVYPAEYNTSYVVTDDGRTIVFASPNKGTVTIIAATVEDGKAVITSVTMYNGVSPDNQEEEKSKPKKDTLESVVADGAKDKTPESLKALAESFESVVSGIERGTVTSVTGARETFRGAWVQNAVSINPELINTMSGYITLISDKIDNTSLDTIKRDYAIIAKTIRNNITMQNKKVQCPDGNCNTNYRVRWYR